MQWHTEALKSFLFGSSDYKDKHFYNNNIHYGIINSIQRLVWLKRKKTASINLIKGPLIIFLQANRVQNTMNHRFRVTIFQSYPRF